MAMDAIGGIFRKGTRQKPEFKCASFADILGPKANPIHIVLRKRLHVSLQLRKLPIQAGVTRRISFGQGTAFHK
ncbi:hypothetical protein [Bradyrhizobium sp. TM239]|uniref:hypothetical protein n=1 Tax=Bradyrhizobium sp. TM239 TaxID=2599802 RepID=UPI0027D73D1D|nr:hypothetical protein TM239_01730 [Bradyrhizobium sp. TM239]